MRLGPGLGLENGHSHGQVRIGEICIKNSLNN